MKPTQTNIRNISVQQCSIHNRIIMKVITIEYYKRFSLKSMGLKNNYSLCNPPCEE